MGPHIHLGAYEMGPLVVQSAKPVFFLTFSKESSVHRFLPKEENKKPLKVSGLSKSEVSLHFFYELK